MKRKKRKIIDEDTLAHMYFLFSKYNRKEPDEDGYRLTLKKIASILKKSKNIVLYQYSEYQKRRPEEIQLIKKNRLRKWQMKKKKDIK